MTKTRMWLTTMLTTLTLSFNGAVLGEDIIVWQDEGAKIIRRANIDESPVVDVVQTQLPGTGLAVDFQRGQVYWTSVGDRPSIQRVNLDGTGFETLITQGVTVPLGIELDPIDGKMYWADQGPSKICRANLDGSEVEALVTSDTLYPHDIALNIVDGKMYWVDSNENTIQRADLDGSNIEIIVAPLGPKGRSPSLRGLALDEVHDKLYWTAQGFGSIQRSNLDGSNIETVVHVPGWNGPDGIAVDSRAGKIYWTGLNEVLGIQRANLDGKRIRNVVTRGLQIPRGIEVGRAPQRFLRAGAAQTQTVAVDLRAARKDYIAKIRRGEIRLPANDAGTTEDRLRQVDRDAFESWIRKQPIGTVAQLPEFNARIFKIIDGKNAIIGENEQSLIWIAGYETRDFGEGSDMLLETATITIGTRDFESTAGKTRLRSIERTDDVDRVAPESK